MGFFRAIHRWGGGQKGGGGGAKRPTPPPLPKICHTYPTLEFQHFLLWQIKYRGNYMKMHFTSAFSWQCFCRSWQDFMLRASAFTSTTLAKTSARSKLVRLLPLIHISPRIRSIMCTIIAVQILLYKHCYSNAMCSFLTSKIVF